jgi:hypothetical protein
LPIYIRPYPKCYLACIGNSVSITVYDVCEYGIADYHGTLEEHVGCGTDVGVGVDVGGIGVGGIGVGGTQEGSLIQLPVPSQERIPFHSVQYVPTFLNF